MTPSASATASAAADRSAAVPMATEATDGPVRLRNPLATYPGRMTDAAAATALDRELDELFARPAEEGVSLAVVVQRHGEVVTERYGVRPANLFEPDPQPVTA